MYKIEKIEMRTFNEMLLSDPEIKSNYYKWFDDPIVTKHNSQGLFCKTKKEFERFFNEIAEGSVVVFGILSPSGNSLLHIGNVSLQRFNWVYRSAELAIVIGESDFFGKGIATESCKKIIEHGFLKLNLNRIWSGTSATNLGMQHVFEKIGMTKEGVMRDGMFLNGEYQDIIQASILKKEWKGGKSGDN